MSKKIELRLEDFLQILWNKAINYGVCRKGVAGIQDPTEWKSVTCFVTVDSCGPQGVQCFELRINQSWGTEVKLTWLAPRYGKIQKRDRQKIDAYYDASFYQGASESRPFTPEVIQQLVYLLTDERNVWTSRRPTTDAEQISLDAGDLTNNLVKSCRAPNLSSKVY